MTGSELHRRVFTGSLGLSTQISEPSLIQDVVGTRNRIGRVVLSRSVFDEPLKRLMSF